MGVTGYVTSPTFTILQVHEEGRLPLYHFDWYRLSGAEELYELAMDEYLQNGGVAVVEWPCRAPEAVPACRLEVGDHPPGRHGPGALLYLRGRVSGSWTGKDEFDESVGGGYVGPVAGVAVLKDGEVAYEGAAVNRLTHSVNLMPMIEEALGRAGLDVSEIGLYAAVTGPGSFTGVRIGVSAVKGMAHGAGKPCVGVDALEALAAGACLSDALICPIQDARAGQVYGAAFLAGMPPVRVLPNMAEALPAYLDRALAVAGERRLYFVGDGVNTYRDALVERLGERAVIAPAHMRYLRPASVGELAWLNRERCVDYLALMPVYLRAPQAERERARRLGGGA